jgi:hypothetical protein
VVDAAAEKVKEAKAPTKAAVKATKATKAKKEGNPDKETN